MLKFIIFIAIFTTIIGIGHWLVLRVLFRAFNIKKRVWLWTLFATLFFVSMLFASRPIGGIFRSLAMDYLGFLSFAVLTFSIGQLLYWLLSKTTIPLLNFKNYTYILIGLAVVLSGFASYQYFKPITVERLTIQSQKVDRAIKIVQISDTQLGTTSVARMQQAFQLAYQLKPDIIAFTGDLIDASNYKQQDFDIMQQSPYPIVFIRGNHELYHDEQRILDYVKDLKPVVLLQDSRMTIKGIEFVGVDYRDDKNPVLKAMQDLKPTQSLYSVFLYHNPVVVDQAFANGYDLQLYGHTHAGQIFPWTWLLTMLNPYANGLFNIGEQYSYTTDGASLWGPRMRLGSQNEIMEIIIQPKR